MLPPEGTFFRRGLALGMTLAETFTIIVFVLLMISAVLLRQAIRARDHARAERDEVRVETVIAREMLSRGVMSWANTDAWFNEARRLREQRDSALRRVEEAARAVASAEARAQEARAMLEEADSYAGVADVVRRLELREEVEQLRDSVARADKRSTDEEARADSLEDRARRAEAISDAVALQVAEDLQVTPVEAVEKLATAASTMETIRQLDSARRTIAFLDERLGELETAAGDTSLRAVQDSVSVLTDTLTAARQRIVTAERERSDAVGRVESLEAQLRALGTGIDPSPCWLDSDRNPEHIFRVELTDRGMRVFNIAPVDRADDEAMSFAEQLEDGREYTAEEFLRLTRPIYEFGRSRTETFGSLGCRYWVEAIDQTGVRKDIFQARENQLGRHFWYRW